MVKIGEEAKNRKLGKQVKIYGEFINFAQIGGIRKGRRVWGTGGTVLLKTWGGDGPCIRPPNILTSTVIGCEVKYELTKKRVSRRNFLLWNRGFWSRKRS